MNIREIATARLREYENNPRNNDLAVEKVKYSIQRFGFLFPIVVDINYVIVAGHTRVRACRELGIQHVPCIIADELTEEQVNFFRLVDNKTSEYSDWDFEKLQNELSQVDLTLDMNQLLLEQFELSAEVFDIEPEQAEIKIPSFNFMGVNDKPKESKPRVSTICGQDTKQCVQDPMQNKSESSTDIHLESAYVAPDSTEFIQTSTIDSEPVPQNADSMTPVIESAPASEETKKSKAILPFCQFRFGDVAFFISQVELDHLNAKYAEYIDSGAILTGSFADYLLKGVENRD